MTDAFLHDESANKGISPSWESPVALQNDEEIEKRLKFERMLAELSAKFVHLQSKEVDKEIEKGLILIIDTLGVDRASLAQFSKDMRSLPVTHTYSMPGVALLSSAMLDKVIPWYVGKARKGEVVAVTNVRDLPSEAEFDRKWLIKHNTQSNLVIPLNVGGALLGVLGLATTQYPRAWPDDLIQRLKLTGEIFANALMRQRNELELQKAFDRIRELKDQLQAENIYLRGEIEQSSRFREIVGQSKAIQSVLKQVERVAPTDATAFILGETGTGKELLAKAIHQLSRRSERTMVKVNLAAIPPTLIETELFGREKGAYTGADSQQIGRFEMANGSTLFLDEIGELPLALQVKLLRVLQERQFERVGSARTQSLDVRIIAATNQDILEAVSQGRFREDLFYRLNVFPIHVPPLRERLEDIPLLVEAIVGEFSEAMGKAFKRISQKSMNALMQYSWPGNIRELRNVIERAMIMGSGTTLHIDMPKGDAPVAPAGLNLNDAIKRHILSVLEMTRWRISGEYGAARILGLPPTTLASKMKKLGIKREKFQSTPF